MPRVENAGDNVVAWCERTGDGSSTHDVCKSCYKQILANPKAFDFDRYNGDPVGADGWEGDVEHPTYDECDYQCEACGKPLTSKDD